MIKSTRKDGLIPLEEHETAVLIRESRHHDALATRIGPGGVALDPAKSPWALPILARLRGVTMEDGAGI